MMFRNRFEGMGLLGVPPTPTYSLSIFAFIASLTSPGLRSLGAAGAGGSCACVFETETRSTRSTRAVSDRGAATACTREARGGARFRARRRKRRERLAADGCLRETENAASGVRGRGDALAYLFGRGLVLRAGEDGIQRADGLVRLGLGRRAPRGAASRPDRGSGDEAIRLAHRRGGRAARGNARARGGRHDDGVSSEHRGVHGHDERRSEDTRREWKCRTLGAAASASDVAAECDTTVAFRQVARELPRNTSSKVGIFGPAGARLGATMMREGGPAYENATDGFDGIDMEAANRRATRRVTTANAVLGGCVPSSRRRIERRALTSTPPRALRPSFLRDHAARRSECERLERSRLRRASRGTRTRRDGLTNLPASRAPETATHVCDDRPKRKHVLLRAGWSAFWRSRSSRSRGSTRRLRRARRETLAPAAPSRLRSRSV